MKRCFFFLDCNIFSLSAFGQIVTLAYRTIANHKEYPNKTLVGNRRILIQIGRTEIIKIEKHNWYFSKK